MTFVDAIKAGFKNFTDFKGTASRSEFWYWVLFTVLLAAVLDQIDTLAGIGGMSGIGLSSLSSLILFIPNLSITFRRLHDAGFSGWLYALNAIPLLALAWVISSFISNWQASGLPSDETLLVESMDEFIATQSGPIYDALMAGAFNETATSFLVLLFSSIAVGVAFIIFYTRKTKTAEQGNKYAGATAAPQLYDGGTTS
jgi:uncharacterized membrane protein YhaH (DUF805 family)